MFRVSRTDIGARGHVLHSILFLLHTFKVDFGQILFKHTKTIIATQIFSMFKKKRNPILESISES